MESTSTSGVAGVPPCGGAEPTSWRHFRLDRIDAITITEIEFTPKANVTLPSGELHAYAFTDDERGMAPILKLEGEA